ncbi:cytoplasmic dynein 2 light intermediate chain 1 [Anticarsia gemmatalis]|uniref:cytoplasmic dynein 2 light intermediate chain 1 n=1 Tax=Anticarsia gemmatalis TaxID=129554 RepID=UPI003F760462
MLSIPEIATQLIDKSLTNANENNCRTIFLVGSKYVGKTTLLYAFLEKNEQPRETLVVEYSFGRKSNQRQGIDKTLCHIWEYGGKLDTLNNVLASIPVRGKYFYCVMIDLSKIKSIWETLELCVETMNQIYSGSESSPELIIIGGKYDNFKNYDSEIKKVVCVTLRSFALLTNAHLTFYSSKEPQLLRRAKDMLFSIGFGNGIPVKDKNTNYAKPLFIPKGSDTWESIGVPSSTMDQVKIRHLSKIPPNVPSTENISTDMQQHAHPEAALDSIVVSKYNELRNMDSLDVSIDYLLSNNK